MQLQHAGVEFSELMVYSHRRDRCKNLIFASSLCLLADRQRIKRFSLFYSYVTHSEFFVLQSNY